MFFDKLRERIIMGFSDNDNILPINSAEQQYPASDELFLRPGLKSP